MADEDRYRIAVIGAGAMGSLFGAMLGAAADVFLIDPWEAHVRAIRNHGLSVEDPDGVVRTVPLFAAADPSAVDRPADLAIIFTKSGATREAGETARRLLRSGGAALTLQNGIGNGEILAGILGAARVITGVTAHGGTLLGPGRVRHAGRGPTHIGETPHPDLRRLVATFREAGIETAVSGDLSAIVWGKLVVNVGINALAAILRVPNGALADAPAGERIMAQAVSEAVAVAGALGIALPFDDALERVKTVCRNTGPNRASMLQDVLRGAPTEISVINRAVVRKGAEVGVATPCNRFLSEIIEALEETADRRVPAADNPPGGR